MLLQILVLVVLILVNGVFASSEIAFLSVNKLKLKQEVKKKNKKAIKIQKLIDNPSGFLATIQIGITLAGFLASAFAAETFADMIVENLTFVTISASILKPIVVVIVTIVLSYFTLVFGELVPKRLALFYPEKISYFVVNMITVLMKVAYPFVWLLTKSTNVVAKLFGIRDQKEEHMTEEELKMIIAQGKDEGAIESGEKDLIFNIFNFNDTEVKDIMRVKEKVVALPLTIDRKELVDILKKEKYTRLPVYGDNINDIVGVLNVKDLISFFTKDSEYDLKKIIRRPYFIEETEKVDDAFRRMQKDRQGMGIVMRNDTEFVGIVTTEDAIEEIVGNIFDEYDEVESREEKESKE